MPAPALRQEVAEAIRSVTPESEHWRSGEQADAVVDMLMVRWQIKRPDGYRALQEDIGVVPRLRAYRTGHHPLRRGGFLA